MIYTAGRPWGGSSPLAPNARPQNGTPRTAVHGKEPHALEHGEEPRTSGHRVEPSHARAQSGTAGTHCFRRRQVEHTARLHAGILTPGCCSPLSSNPPQTHPLIHGGDLLRPHPRQAPIRLSWGDQVSKVVAREAIQNISGSFFEKSYPLAMCTMMTFGTLSDPMGLHFVMQSGTLRVWLETITDPNREPLHSPDL
jgi:hypothetical protein